LVVSIERSEVRLFHYVALSERVRQEQERKMLEEATEEHGVAFCAQGVIRLRVATSEEKIFTFHYSSIELEEGDGNDDDNEQGGRVCSQGRTR
jgi:hypothetical protein